MLFLIGGSLTFTIICLGIGYFGVGLFLLSAMTNAPKKRVRDVFDELFSSILVAAIVVLVLAWLGYFWIIVLGIALVMICVIVPIIWKNRL